MLRVSAVCVEIDGRCVLQGVSFEVGRGEFAALRAERGGKTTLLNAALGLVPLAGGTIEVLGPAGPGSAAVGYLPQTKPLSPRFAARVMEMILANERGAWPFASLRGSANAPAPALARVGGERLLHLPLRGLSGGENTARVLARAIISERKLLLLDEPMAGVHDGAGSSSSNCSAAWPSATSSPPCS